MPITIPTKDELAQMSWRQRDQWRQRLLATQEQVTQARAYLLAHTELVFARPTNPGPHERLGSLTQQLAEAIRLTLDPDPDADEHWAQLTRIVYHADNDTRLPELATA